MRRQILGWEAKRPLGIKYGRWVVKASRTHIALFVMRVADVMYCNRTEPAPQLYPMLSQISRSSRMYIQRGTPRNREVPSPPYRKKGVEVEGGGLSNHRTAEPYTRSSGRAGSCRPIRSTSASCSWSSCSKLALVTPVLP